MLNRFHKLVFLCALAVLGCMAGLSGAVARAAEISQVSAVQAIHAGLGVYKASQHVVIGFDLAAPADVTVKISRQQRPSGPDTAVLADPVLVRTFKLGHLSAGAHTVIWDGLNQQGQPITEPVLGIQRQQFPAYLKKRAKNPALAGKPFNPMELIKYLPINLFRVTVQADGHADAVNFQRAVGPVAAWGTTGQYFVAGAALPNGNLVALDWLSGKVFQLDPALSPLTVIPKVVAQYSSNVALQGSVIFADNRGNVYAADGNGLFKYKLDGRQGRWSYKAPYIHNNIARLGNKLDQKLPVAKKPGFFFGGVGGCAIGPHDNIYIFKKLPDGAASIEVFASSGRYLRSIPLPAPYSGPWIYVNKDGGIWVSGLYCNNRINPRTGKVEATITQGTICFDSKGDILTWGNATVNRFTAQGRPDPFTADSPYLRAKAAYQVQAGSLDFSLPKGVTRTQSPDRDKAINCVIPGIHGDFYVVLGNGRGGYYDHEAKRPVLHLDRNGKVIPKLLALAFGQDLPGNIFVGHEPAQVEVYASNLHAHPVNLVAHWTTTDFYGKTTSGDKRFTLAPHTHSVVPLALPMPEYGWYHLQGTVRHGAKNVLVFHASAARVRRRSLKPSMDSPFAMCWGTNYYLSGVSGVKKERVGMMPLNCAYAPGMLNPDDPAITNFRTGGQTGTITEALKWGVRLPIMLTYGEPWMGNGWMTPIYNYDQWLDGIVVPLLDRFKAPADDLTHIQFWNEPGDFLYGDHPDREHYALVQKLVWSLSKARDKDLQAIPDGDPGYYRMLQVTLPRYGANAYCDAVPCHYPGAAMVSWNKMSLSGLFEGKAVTLKQLVRVRDKDYPGEPILVTEEGSWGANGIAAREIATTVTRIMIPEIAAGADEVYWFAQNADGFAGPPMMCHQGNTPWPIYCQYATMTKHLQGRAFLSVVKLDTPATFAYLFGRGEEMVLPIWAVKGKPVVNLNLGVPSVTVYNAMDQQRTVPTDHGVLHLQLSLQCQYVVFKKTAWAVDLIKARLHRQLKKLHIAEVGAIAQAITATCPMAARNNAAMSRLYYLVQAARLAAYAGAAPAWAGAVSAHVLAQTAQAAIVRREGADGYLRRSRVALQWALRMARAVHRQGPVVGAPLTWATAMAVRATAGLTQVEKPCYPGAVVNAYVAGYGKIAKIRATKGDTIKSCGRRKVGGVT